MGMVQIRRLARWSRRGIWVLLAWLLGHAAFLLIDGFRLPVLPADLAVVFGSKVHPDGQPSSGLERRLERALELYRKGAVKAILVSGGRGAEGFQEGDVMRDVLVRNAVPAPAIILARAENNTRLTAIHPPPLMQARGWRPAVVVSRSEEHPSELQSP